MTQDEIIRMAREAGLWPAVTDMFPKELERFAALVAAHERKKWEPVFSKNKPAPKIENGNVYFEAGLYTPLEVQLAIDLLTEREKQAEQEPVAWICHKQNGEKSLWWNKSQALDRNAGHEFTPLYAAPVRTKDLTDAELRQVLDRNCGDGLMAIARAVIAADREKNK